PQDTTAEQEQDDGAQQHFSSHRLQQVLQPVGEGLADRAGALSGRVGGFVNQREQAVPQRSSQRDGQRNRAVTNRRIGNRSDRGTPLIPSARKQLVQPDPQRASHRVAKLGV